LVGKSAVDRGGSRRHGSWTPLEKGGFAQPSVSQIQPSRLPGTALHLRQLCAKRSISRSRHSWRAIAPCDSECQMEIPMRSLFLTVSCLLVPSLPAFAEVASVTIASRAAVAEGHAFGTTG